MPTPPTAPSVAIWTDAQRAPNTLAILQKMGSSIRPVVVGGPRIATLSALVTATDCPTTDDPRRLLVDYPADYLLLHSAEAIDFTDVQQAARNGATVLAIEPLTGDLNKLIRTNPPDTTRKPTRQTVQPNTPDVPSSLNSGPDSPTGQICWATALENSPGWTVATDPDAAIGRTHTVIVQSLGDANQCSLFARVFDGWRVILQLGALPDTIEASISGGTSHLTQDLGGITGTLTAHARLSDGSSALLAASDCAGQWSRSAQIIGQTGRVLVTDGGYRLVNSDCCSQDELMIDQDPPTLPDVVVRRWRQLIEHRDVPAIPIADSRVLACCMASVLSARTGQPENPAKLIQLAGA